jgi:hypothetical protein
VVGVLEVRSFVEELVSAGRGGPCRHACGRRSEKQIARGAHKAKGCRTANAFAGKVPAAEGGRYTALSIAAIVARRKIPAS